jgi:hypothetical protein
VKKIGGERRDERMKEKEWFPHSLAVIRPTINSESNESNRDNFAVRERTAAERRAETVKSRRRERERQSDETTASRRREEGAMEEAGEGEPTAQG